MQCKNFSSKIFVKKKNYDKPSDKQKKITLIRSHYPILSYPIPKKYMSSIQYIVIVYCCYSIPINPKNNF